MNLSEQCISPSIGGYFQLELPELHRHYRQDVMFYQSARAALRALLQAGRPERVLIPKYICDAILSSLIDEEVDYQWYELDENLEVPNTIELKDGEWLFYVNYFGICQTQIEQLVKRYPPEQIVFDFSQAFFAKPKIESLATIYSPRKFFGVPDGGFLLTTLDIAQPKLQDTGSMSRMTHLLRRLYEQPEFGYSDYLFAEDSLKDTNPMLMSGLTQRLLRSIDYEAVQKKRTQNFTYLHKRLKSNNAFKIDERTVIAPLCYPFRTNNSNLRECLIKNKVFLPTYWRDASNRVSPNWNQNMIEGLLPLPIDQRYGEEEMERMISIISDEE